MTVLRCLPLAIYYVQRDISVEEPFLGHGVMTACSNKTIKMHVRNVRKIQTIQPMYYYNNKQAQNPLYD